MNFRSFFSFDFPFHSVTHSAKERIILYVRHLGWVLRPDIFIIIPWNFLKFSYNFFRLSHYSKVNQFSFFFRQIVIFITITKTNVLFISKSYPHYSHLSLLIMWITFRKSFIFPHFFDFSMLISWKLLFFIFLLFWIFLSYFVHFDYPYIFLGKYRF